MSKFLLGNKKKLRAVRTGLMVMLLIIGLLTRTNIFRTPKRAGIFPTKGTAARIIDGDSFYLTNGAEIRLLEINAPEMRGAHKQLAERAQIKLTKLLGSGQLTLTHGRTLRDKYGRFLAYVFAEDKDGREILVNAEIVRMGLARAKLYAKAEVHWPQIKQAELEAQKAKCGIWK